jgi:triosephosphate isomerase (TIM)
VKRPAGHAGRDIVIGISLKMYFGYQETLDWCARVRAIAEASPAVSEGGVRLFVMPSFPLLLPVIEMFQGTLIDVGAQNLHFEDRGPFTGEVSASMLAEIGCRLVEVGHAERRRLFGDSEPVVALKVGAALRNSVRPVICVGEEEEAISTADACRESTRLLASALAGAGRDDAGGTVVVAYEPLWAIGADEPAPEGHIADVCRSLRELLVSTRPEVDDRVIYGGSAGPGLLERLGDAVDGLFLGRYVHDAEALKAVLEEAGRVFDLRHHAERSRLA